jgi:hypothetical protein
MNAYQELNVVNTPKNKGGISGYSVASFLLSATPLAILLDSVVNRYLPIAQYT